MYMFACKTNVSTRTDVHVKIIDVYDFEKYIESNVE